MRENKWRGIRYGALDWWNCSAENQLRYGGTNVLLLCCKKYIQCLCKLLPTGLLAQKVSLLIYSWGCLNTSFLCVIIRTGFFVAVVPDLWVAFSRLKILLRLSQSRFFFTTSGFIGVVVWDGNSWWGFPYWVSWCEYSRQPLSKMSQTGILGEIVQSEYLANLSQSGIHGDIISDFLVRAPLVVPIVLLNVSQISCRDLPWLDFFMKSFHTGKLRWVPHL